MQVQKLLYQEARALGPEEKLISNLDSENFDASYLGIATDAEDDGPDEIAELSETAIDRDRGGPLAPRDGTPLVRLDRTVTIPKKALTNQADALLNQNPVPKCANDNYRAPKESWHLRDAITRGNIGSENERLPFLKTMHRLRYLLDESNRDPVGLSVHTPGKPTSTDYGPQKTADGKHIYLTGESLDRKKKNVEAQTGDDERHIGAVRKASKSGPVDNSAFDPYRDDPLVFRQIDARQELDEVIAATGPLWVHLHKAVTDGAITMEQVGISFGVTRGTKASGTGTAVMTVALRVATEAIDRTRMNSDSYIRWLRTQPDCTPVPARRLKRAYDALKQQDHHSAA